LTTFLIASILLSSTAAAIATAIVDGVYKDQGQNYLL
jgi:hypothetical protein